MDVSIKTKTPKIRTTREPSPEPGPTGPEPSLDELVARRMLDWHGDTLIDIYIDRVRRAEVGWLADRDDPYTGYQRMNGWCASRRSWSREKHEADAHAGLLRAVATGADVVPIDEAAIDAAVAKDLLSLYFRNCRGAFGRLVAAARRKKDSAASELAELETRATVGELFDPTRAAGWGELRDLLGRQQELTLTIGRTESLLDDLGPALAERVAPILDDAGEARVILGLALALLPTTLARPEDDPELARLEEAMGSARRRHDALGDAGTSSEKASWAEMQRELIAPIEDARAARLAVIESGRSLAATAALDDVRMRVEAVREGDVSAIEALIAAARDGEGDFPGGFGDRLHDAATAAFAETDAVAWAGLLESA